MSTSGELQFRLSYEVSPITLVDGLASELPGGALGVLSLLAGDSFGGLLVGAGGGPGLDLFPVTFMPLPGSTIIDNQIAKYPQANMVIAANAIINQPLRISMLMRIPAGKIIGGYSGKAAVLQAFRSTLAQHIVSEGSFVVETPSFPWSNCLLLNVADVSGGESRQPQIEWKLDFEQPLISADSGSGYSMNSTTGSMDAGGVTDGTPSGSAAVTGAPETVSSPAAVPNNVGSAPVIDNGPGGGAGFGGGSGGSPFQGARA